MEVGLQKQSALKWVIASGIQTPKFGQQKRPSALLLRVKREDTWYLGFDGDNVALLLVLLGHTERRFNAIIAVVAVIVGVRLPDSIDPYNHAELTPIIAPLGDR